MRCFSGLQHSSKRLKYTALVHLNDYRLLNQLSGSSTALEEDLLQYATEWKYIRSFIVETENACYSMGCPLHSALPPLHLNAFPTQGKHARKRALFKSLLHVQAIPV